MPDPGSCPGQTLISLPRHVVSRGHPVSFWIALKLHFVPRLRGNDNRGVFSCRINIYILVIDVQNTVEMIDLVFYKTGGIFCCRQNILCAM